MIIIYLEEEVKMDIVEDQIILKMIKIIIYLEEEEMPLGMTLVKKEKIIIMHQEEQQLVQGKKDLINMVMEKGKEEISMEIMTIIIIYQEELEKT
jgi:hypothetical protein